MSSKTCRVCGTRIDPVAGDVHPGCELPMPNVARRRTIPPTVPPAGPRTFRAQTMVSHDANPVQRRAASRALPRSGTKRREVYEVIASSGRRGMTFDEMRLVTGWSYSHLGPRVRELRGAMGLPVLVVDTGLTRRGDSGADQSVYVLACWADQV